jgi:multimeric flavodoxin WrbA
MKIVIMSGSPKGEKSVTLQYMKYICKNFPGHEYQIYHIGRDIQQIEKDRKTYDGIISDVRAADAVVWCTPVFFLVVPSQLMRFIELLFERNSLDAFSWKCATALTTSAKYYDHTAHDYLDAVSHDLGMKYVKGLSAEMGDMLDLQKKWHVLKFWKHFFSCVEQKLFDETLYASDAAQIPEYQGLPGTAAPKSQNKKITLLTDAIPEDVNLNRMVEIFARRIPNDLEMINIRKIDMRAGCVSCYACAESNVCSIHDEVKSVSDKFFAADAIVMAGSVRHRFLSARWKMFFDRLFVYGHAPVFAGKQFAFILSGDFSGNPHVRMVCEGMIETSLANNAGFVTDESGDAAQITAQLEDLGKKILLCVDQNYVRPQTFRGVGGHMIFRDLVYRLKWFFEADYAYYKKHGLLDYPQYDLRARMHNLMMGLLLKFPGMRKKIMKKSCEEMLKPYEKAMVKEKGLH